ncbi:MAG: penicillin-binding protein 1C [Candidatus Edwardsbacteria bacterium]
MNKRHRIILAILQYPNFNNYHELTRIDIKSPFLRFLERMGRIPLVFIRVHSWFILVLALGWLGYHILMSLSLLVFPLPMDVLEQGYSTVHLASNEELLRISLSPSGKYRIKLRLEDFSEYLSKGFIIYEDNYFYYHPGVNPFALIRALVTNIRKGKIVSGGSTITMQVAKLMEPKERTAKSKIIEIFRALQLEEKYSKKEILEIYLNLVPMGGNIEGTGAAAYLYFGKPAKYLSLAESALLIGLPKSPNRYRPDRAVERAEKQRNLVLNKIATKLKVQTELVQTAKNLKIPQQRFKNSYETPSLIVRTQAIGPKFVKRYSIDMALQRYCEQSLAKAVDKFKINGCHNGAVIVLDNHTMEVLVYVGSVNFYDSIYGGQINCANIKRSPGSLLKPFLYAVGMERGLVTPKKILFDIERNYQGYNPINFNRKFLGPVTAEDALIGSMNVPAVNLEYELGKDGLSSFIRETHLSDEKRIKIDAGLSLVLGAYPMTLEELVKLYACLANGGKLREIRFFKDDCGRNEGFSVLTPEACFIITTMLSEIERPDLPQCWEFTNNRGRIAFKTGTSFGLRDAWCIGYNPDYTVGVWVGNVDCKGSDVLVGIKAAAPITVDILNHLTRYKDSWFKRPDKVQQREVCAISGEVAGPYCHRTVWDYYIPGISSNKICAVHKQIHLRKSDGLEVCRFCMNQSADKYYSKVVEVWPPEVANYLRASGRKIEKIPRHNPECNTINICGGLKIKSPLSGGYYALNERLDSQEQKILLQAESDTDCEPIYWFLDDKFIYQGSPDQTFYIKPVPGEHTVTIIDSRGRNEEVTFVVHKRLFPNINAWTTD